MNDLAYMTRPNRNSGPVEYIPMRCHSLNLILGGGLPIGQAHEWYAAEGSGKSTLAYETMSIAVSQLGMVGILYDMEDCADDTRMAKFGLVNGVNFVRVDDVNSIEQIVTDLQEKLKQMKSAKDNRRIFVVVDSVGATPPQAHIDSKDYASHLKVGADALAWKNMLRLYNRVLKGGKRVTLLLLNHQTAVINTSGYGRGPKYTSPGGHAVKHHAYVRARLTRVGWLENADKQKIGAEVLFKTEKNKTAPPHQEVRIPIYFGNPELLPEEDYVGSWDAYACILYCKEVGMITTRGSKSTMTLFNEKDEPYEVSWIGAVEFVQNVYPEHVACIHNTMRWWHYRYNRQNDAGVIQVATAPVEETESVDE